MVNGGIIVAIIIGLGVVIGAILIFPMALRTPPFHTNTGSDIVNTVSIVTIPEGASLAYSGKGFEPTTIKVVIGTNNTVRWVNEDSIPYTVASDTDYNDPLSGLFTTGVRPEEEGGPFMMPGKYYEFTFTNSGVFDYHSIPHPQL